MGGVIKTVLSIFSVNFLHVELFQSIVKDKKKDKDFPKQQLEIFLENFMNIVESTFKIIQT